MQIALLRVLASLPLRLLHTLGKCLGWLIYIASPTYAKRIKENILQSQIAKDKASYRRLVRATIAELGKTILELPAIWLRSDAQVERLIVACDGWEKVEAARALGKGLIFLTPHLGCFEVAGFYIAQRMPLNILYRPPKLKSMEPIMRLGRQRGQAKLAPTTLGGVRALLKGLKQGEAVGLLPDQAPSAGDGTWADFFGKPAYTMTLVSRLQQAANAVVFLTFAKRLSKGQGYHIYMQTLAEADTLISPAEINQAIENLIRLCPEQYLWSYNRYKIPAGANPAQIQSVEHLSVEKE